MFAVGLHYLNSPSKMDWDIPL